MLFFIVFFVRANKSRIRPRPMDTDADPSSSIRSCDSHSPSSYARDIDKPDRDPTGVCGMAKSAYSGVKAVYGALEVAMLCVSAETVLGETLQPCGY